MEDSKRYLMIEGRREGYGVDQLHRTMTVRDLIEYLEQFDDETLVVLNNDNRYTYGSITESSFQEAWFNEDGDETDEFGNDVEKEDW